MLLFESATEHARGDYSVYSEKSDEGAVNKATMESEMGGQEGGEGQCRKKDW